MPDYKEFEEKETELFPSEVIALKARRIFVEMLEESLDLTASERDRYKRLYINIAGAFERFREEAGEQTEILRSVVSQLKEEKKELQEENSYLTMANDRLCAMVDDFSMKKKTLMKEVLQSIREVESQFGSKSKKIIISQVLEDVERIFTRYGMAGEELDAKDVP